MKPELLQTITAVDPEIRDQSLERLCHDATRDELLEACHELDEFRRNCTNLYQRVRALFYLAAIYRYLLPPRFSPEAGGRVPYSGFQHLLQRRFDEAIDEFRDELVTAGATDTICSALAAAYYELAFTTLADQVRRCVRSVQGNQWMFRIGHALDHPLKLRRELLEREPGAGLFPVLRERTPVRMDLSHSGWSDIFFLGMDFPEGARVLNVSVDLAVYGRDASPIPPIEVYLRVIDEPILRLVSVDMRARTDVETVSQVFDFAGDYLGLVKAGLIAAGLVPSGLEGCEQRISEVFAPMIGPGLGLEIATKVNDIPKGSRLAVSTNLLAGIISVCMRATSQTTAFTGPLDDRDRRLVAARAVLGEWLGGSGGGWQDSGGVWPGIKIIEGQPARPGDPEFGVSRGRLLPDHRVYSLDEVDAATRQKLCDSLVLVHGGMAQDVGPILRMVTEKYLLRGEQEWQARQDAIALLRAIEAALARGDVQELADCTTRNFFGPIQTIIPWASNHYTETLIQQVRARYADRFWGFLMLGGMSGGGMGFLFDPAVKAEARDFLLSTMRATKRDLEDSFPFAMDPVVYDFSINDVGTTAEIFPASAVLMPPEYYALVLPDWVRRDSRELSSACRAELQRVAMESKAGGRLAGSGGVLLSSLLPHADRQAGTELSLGERLSQCGFDPQLHERIRRDLKAGRIGLAQNRLPVSTEILDVTPADVCDSRRAVTPAMREAGVRALASGEVGVFTLAAGAGSRWTRGAGVVKAVHRFHRFAGRYRSFLEVHLAKTRQSALRFQGPIPHIIATSYLTDGPIRRALDQSGSFGYPGTVLTSPGQSVGLRMIPMVRDLRFTWEETAHQVLDEQAQKVRDSLHAALISWAEASGCGSDYTDNLATQCLHPVGHWFEVPSLLRNGTLRRLLTQQPQLKHLMLHNVDSLGADLDPGLLGLHIDSGACLTFEVINRRIDDRGGGLARIDGRVRLIEGLAMPREEDEFNLTYYNSLTTWIDIDRLLKVFELNRDLLADSEAVTAAVRKLSLRLPTYITIKDVKRRWGHGQEDILPVSQFEKLWGDMSAIPEVDCRFVVVPRERGQQLKEQAQLDGWLRDGSAAWIESLGHWQT